MKRLLHAVPAFRGFTVKGTTMKPTLMAASAISAMIASISSKGKELADLIHTTAVQTVLHAQEHGDATLADNLVKAVRENMPGYVWQGLVKWYRTHSPIAWDAKGEVYLLKEGQPGFKPFNPEAAEAAPAANDQAVKNRTDREIEPFSIGLVKKRIHGFQAQLDKAIAEGGRGVTGDPAAVRAYLASLVSFADKIAVTTVTEKVFTPKVEIGEEVTEEGAKKAA